MLKDEEIQEIIKEGVIKYSSLDVPLRRQSIDRDIADAAYEKGKTEGEMSERIRVVGILKDKRLKTNALLLARQEIFREIDFGEKARNALKESERAKGRTMTDV